MVFSGDFANKSITIESVTDDLRLHGWIGLPILNRGSTDQQYFYVNGRPVKDKLIAHAVKQAYSDVMFHGQTPRIRAVFGAPKLDGGCQCSSNKT